MGRGLWVVLLLFFVISCKQKSDKVVVKTNVYSSKSANTSVSGVISNPATRFVVLKKGTYADTAYLDEQQRFSIKLHVPVSGYFVFLDGKSNFKIFLSPNDALNISFDASNVFSTIQFAGVGSEPNIYIKDKYLMQLGHGIPMTQLYEYPVPEFRHLVDSFYVINKMFLNAFLERNKNISTTFKEMEQASLTYDRAAQLMEYLNTRGLTEKINESRYLKFLESLSINESTLLDVYEYKLFLNAYIAYFAGKRTRFENASSTDLTLSKMQTVSAKIENQEVKDYLLFTLLRDQVKYYGYKNTDILFKTFEFQCKNEQMKAGILEPYNAYIKLSKKQKAPEIRMVDRNGNKFTLNDFKGQYVYIDIWASWCLPCRKEAPFLEELKEEFKHKNIAFVGISIDSKKEDWIDFLDISGNNDHQFLVSEIQPFLDVYMIKTIPHFLLIDSEGYLIDNNASRPSEKKTAWMEEVPDKVEI